MGDERVLPQTCKGDPGLLCGVHRGLLQVNERARQALASERLAGLAGTVCSGSETWNREPRTELVYVMEGESGL